MKRFEMLVLLCTPCLLSAQSTGKITGKVIDAATLQPISKAHVAITIGGPGGQFVGTLTGSDGSYLLEDVPAGSIRMTVNLEGYKLITERSDAGAAFTLAAGETARRDFVMHPQGRIYGRLVDRDTGKGISGYMVSAVRKESVPGRTSFTFFVPAPGEQKADEFNIPNLESGDYLIRIESNGEAVFVFPADASPKPAPKTSYGLNWYPNVARIDMAVPVHVGEGENRRLEISLRSRETHSISGTLTAPRELEGQPVAFALGATELNSWVAVMPAPGSFRIDNLAPGSYRLTLGGASPAAKARSYMDYMATEADQVLFAGRPESDGVGDYRFEIADHDIEGFNVALRPYAGISGEVRMLEKDAKLPPKMSVRLIPAASMSDSTGIAGGLYAGATPVQEGRFHKAWLHPGEYWPELAGLPKGYAVAQVSFEGANPRNTAIQLSVPDTALTFVLTSQPGAIAGSIRDDNQNPVRGASVVLMPEPFPDQVRPGAIQSRTSGDDGSFVFQDVAPGKYRALALTEADRPNEGDQEYLRRRAAGAETIEVTWAQTTRVDLKQ